MHIVQHHSSSTSILDAEGIAVIGMESEAGAELFTPEALRFVAALVREFRDRREELLARRAEVQKKLDAGMKPDFLPETLKIREGHWAIAPVPDDIQDRRVEITGPVDKKMIINALNSGAKVFMADFEDAHSPTWAGTLQGQQNLREAVRRTLIYDSPEGKPYRLNPETAVLFVRPRGWHLSENHFYVDGRPVPAGLFDFGFYFFHNAQALMDKGSGPYFYLPKLENHLEARLWNDVFRHAQEMLGIPRGTIKATVLIETITAAFEMDEILYELREHSAGLNCGRWDYIFSFIKKFRNRTDFAMPDRAQVTMTTHFLHSYSLLAIQTCHRRGAHAMGGMAAQVPIKNNPEKNEAAMEKVRADKLREVTDGHDGTWVAHPGLVPIAMEIFNKHMPRPNQIDRRRDDVHVTTEDLLQIPRGTITEAGLRTNISVGIQYLEAWLGGLGCVPLYYLMEDAATAEISRTQVWQWVHHPRGILEDGRKITLDLVQAVTAEELEKIRAEVGEQRFKTGKYGEAATMFEQIIANRDFEEFLTLRAYEHLES